MSELSEKIRRQSEIVLILAKVARIVLYVAFGFTLYLLVSTWIPGETPLLRIGGMDVYLTVPQSVLLQPATLFMLTWGLMVLVTCVLLWLLGTRFGAVTEAIRDNEERARFIGIKTTVPRALVYALSAMVTGVAGLLSALNAGFVSPESLHWSVSAITLLMVVVGGFKHPVGAIVGAIVYFLFKDLIQLKTH